MHIVELHRFFLHGFSEIGQILQCEMSQPELVPGIQIVFWLTDWLLK